MSRTYCGYERAVVEREVLDRLQDELRRDSWRN